MRSWRSCVPWPLLRAWRGSESSAGHRQQGESELTSGYLLVEARSPLPGTRAQ